MAGQRLRRIATAIDVARLAGVSQSAVSRTFTPGASVAPPTRAKVVEAARALGYKPNAIARSLITRRSRMVGVAMSYLNNQFYPDVLEALALRLKQRGLHILLFTSDGEGDADPGLMEVLRYQVDALILASTTLSSALAEECRLAGVPVVLFNRTVPGPGLSSVTGDNFGGGQAIARFLAAAGHRRPAFIAGLENSSTSRLREQGFLAGLAEAGLPVPARAIGHYAFEGALAATRQLLAPPTRPDAIFVANDHMALAAIEVARHELGLSVPGDVSIIGFDDVGPARWRSFSLTSYSQPLLPMVDSAVELLDALLASHATPPRAIVVAGELVVRGSARLPPAGLVQSGVNLVWRAA